MIVIFDLDYTLLDTEKFKIDLAKTIGISFEVFSDSYRQFVSGDGTQQRKTRYILNEHLDSLIKSGAVKASEKKQIEMKVEEFLKRIDDYLFAEAEDVLRNLKDRGHELILATFGNPEWHQLKVGNLSIKKYFDQIIITDKDKSPLIEFLKKNDKEIAVVNDNAGETIAMQEALGHCQIILIAGPYSNNCEHNFEEHELIDCLELIK